PPPPADARWYPFTASAGVSVVTAQSTAVAAEVSFGPTFGRPTLSRKGTYHEGWFITPLVESSYGVWGSRSVCLDTSMCASRFTLGGGARVGWGRGLAAVSTGKAHVSTAVFTQLTIAGAALSVPSAPLAPAINWSELVVRGRVGVTASLSPTPWVPSKSAFSIQLALVVEGVPASRLSRGATFGGALGVTF
ncbi:MAG: hypothetical protein JNG84_11795, partial [Archangium sp.]|nr:hypothetical protein [Archangium sp.]